MQIYVIHTEIHQWGYIWRLTKCDFQQPDFEPHAIHVNHTQLNVIWIT